MDNTKLFAMFPGQGAQAVGMGKDLFENFDLAKQRFEEAGEVLGFSLSQVCFEGPIEKLTETQITQPALLTVSTIAFELWAEKNDSSAVVVGAGHSLGEYSALVAAEALSFADALRLVHSRGAFMQEAVPIGKGAMIAVLGKEIDEIQSALGEFEGGTVEVANINAYGQIVLAGGADEIASFSDKHSDWKIKQLQVSAPFHCGLMKPAEEKLAPLLSEVTFSAPKFPIVQNVTAEATSDPEQIRENLKAQVCGSVRWVECVENGITKYGAEHAVEFGSGKVLSGLLRRIQKGFPATAIGTVEDLNS